MAVAAGLGYLLAKSIPLERVLSPYIVASQAIPIVAIAPLLVIWFGPGMFSKVLICALIVFFPVLVNTMVGLRSVPDDLRDLMRSLRATRWQTFRKVIFPCLAPSLLAGFAMAFARGLGEYGSVVFISGNMPMKTEITPLLIITKLEQYDYAGATALAVVMLVVSFIMLLTINLLQWWSGKRMGRS